MSYRVKITLPENIGDELDQFAASAGEPPSTIAAQFVRVGLAAAAEAQRAPVRVSTRLPAPSGRAPPWLEPPHDGRRAWRSEAWATVLALCARYPRELANLEAEWWRNKARVEALGALAAWREEIDNGGSDFRDELSFHAQLADTQRLLEQTPGVGADVFQPNAPPPAEWLDP